MDRRQRKTREAIFEAFSSLLSRKGYSKMLSWAPFIGDPITLAAGIMREPLWSFVLFVALAKLARYLIVAAVALSWLC